MNRAGSAHARQRALSARGAGRGGRRHSGVMRAPPSHPVHFSLQYPLAVECSEPAIAKEFTRTRKIKTHKLCGTLISK